MPFRIEPLRVADSFNAIFDETALIEGRNIAFGLNRIGALITEKPFAWKRVISNFKEVKPDLERMRNETFQRWDKFPFKVSLKMLRLKTMAKVLSWAALLKLNHRFKSLDSLKRVL